MTNVVELAQWRAHKAAQSAELPALECPKCEAICQAVKVDEEGATVYRCVGAEHRAFAWRITEDGSMLSGLRGTRSVYLTP